MFQQKGQLKLGVSREGLEQSIYTLTDCVSHLYVYLHLPSTCPLVHWWLWPEMLQHLLTTYLSSLP